jgi:hypothetical protein
MLVSADPGGREVCDLSLAVIVGSKPAGACM